EVWEESAGDLQSNAVPFREKIAGDQIVEMDFVDRVGGEHLAAMAHVAVAGPLYVEAWAHQVESRPIGRDIQQTRPKIEIAAVTGDKNICADGASNFDLVI